MGLLDVEQKAITRPRPKHYFHANQFTTAPAPVRTYVPPYLATLDIVKYTSGGAV